MPPPEPPSSTARKPGSGRVRRLQEDPVAVNEKAGRLDRARFAELADRFTSCRVVVAGDVMLDRYLAGPAHRVSPEAPVPVVLVEEEWDALGGAANVAANVRALGARCDVVGAVGGDDAGRSIRRTLEAMGAGCHFVQAEERPTTVKTRVLARGQQVVRIDREESRSVAPSVAEDVASRVAERLPGARALVVADYDKGVMSPSVIRRVLDAAAAERVPVLVDPKRRNFFAYRGATVFKPNRSELEAALGGGVRPRDAGWMRDARVRIGCRHLLLTLGAEGMVLASPGGAMEEVRVPARLVYDVSGAGDTVAAVVAVAVAAGAGMPVAVGLAARAAALGVAKVGVAAVTREEIARSLPDPPPAITL